MSQAQSESADADTDESSTEGWDIYPQATQHPHTIIAGTAITDVMFAGRLDDEVEDTGHSVGVVIENPTLARGTAWKNREIPDGFDSAAEFNAALKDAITDAEEYANGREVTEDIQREARGRIEDAVENDVDWDEATEDPYSDGGFYSVHSLKSDYKLADSADRDFEKDEVDGNVLGVSVGAERFNSQPVEELDEDHLLVWYRGMAGQRIMRRLDFNGMPFVRYTEDGYLRKGLLQAPLGWKDGDLDRYPDETPTDVDGYEARGQIAGKRNGLGRPPRVARPPVLRDDVDEEVFIEIDRYDGGDMLSSTIAYNDFDGDDWEEATELDLLLADSPEERLVSEFDLDDEDGIEYIYALFTGEGWQPVPDNAFWGSADVDADGGSFDVDVDVGDEQVEHPTEQEVEFGEMISEKIAGTGANPDDDIFSGEDGKTDLEGLVGLNSDQFGVTPDVDSIRRVVYENTSHLDPEDLDE